MPSYYRSGRFEKNKARHERERTAFNENLRRQVLNRPKLPAYKLCLDIGRDISNLRKQIGLTQIKLAGSINTSRGAISKIENGRHNLTVKTLEKIAKVLDKKIEINFK